MDSKFAYGSRDRDSLCDGDLVHLVHVNAHAARRVQLLVALAALPVLACKGMPHGASESACAAAATKGVAVPHGGE